MNFKKAIILAVPLALSPFLGSPDAVANGKFGKFGKFKTHLSGFEEVPALSSPASGKFEATIKGGTIEYTLSYQGLDSGVRFAHIHFGQFGVNGGVSVFLCANQNAPEPPVPMPPECPPSEGSVSGTLRAEDVIGPAEQGIEPGEIDELLDAIKAGVTYVNVHTEDFPPGEIRGQIERKSGRR